MKKDNLTPAQEICCVMTNIYDAKLTTASGGNLSLRDEVGNIWVTPAGGDKSRYKEEEILKITKDGELVGQGSPSVETAIHKGILDCRPEFRAVVHAHPPSLVAVSLLRQLPETMLMPKIANSVKSIRLAAYGCPGSMELKKNVVREFEENPETNAVILENHGAFVAGEQTLEDTFGIFQDLNFSINLQAKATAFIGGKPRLITEKQLTAYNEAQVPKLDTFRREEISQEELIARESLCDFGSRAYKRGLLTQNIGVLSARLGEDSFLITESGGNNGRLTGKSLVKVKNGLVETGKVPSKSVVLHRKIYEENPHINAIIMAAPANAMVFAVTEAEYDLKTIPECYIVLREKISKFPFGTTITKQEELAQYFREKSPVAIIENDCYVCTGSSLFNAFDKLEVIEFSADAVLQSKLLGGEVKPITEAEVREIKEKFKIT